MSKIFWTNYTLTANHSLVIADWVEVAADATLELEEGATLEIT